MLSGILNVYSKTKIKSSWEKEVLLQKQKKDLQNSVCHLETQSCWYQLLHKLITKLSVLKRSFPGEKVQSWENANVLHVTEHLTTGTVLYSILKVTKMSFSGKKRTSF